MAKVAAEVGSTANTYEVLAKLATGGMADIFLARGHSAAGVERYCVLKRILRERAGDALLGQMFLDEARLAAQLQHPNIASVYDTGKLGESHFFTMEYVHGETVRALLQRSTSVRRPLPLACALTIVAGAAAGLHHAHERKGVDGRALGIVHRDVSPSNLMVSYEGNVKIVDFGVAKAAHRGIETHSGMVKGKISYLSPEQCRGERVDRRSDLFSLGIVMWEMLTGARLFRRDIDFASMMAIVHDEVPPPSARRRDVPREVDEIVLRLLAKSAAKRFQSAAEVVDRIEDVAVRAGIMLSTAAVGRFVRELFGERPEPWLDLAARTAPQDRVSLTASSASGLAASAAAVIEQELARVAALGVAREGDLDDSSDPDDSISSVSIDSTLPVSATAGHALDASVRPIEEPAPLPPIPATAAAPVNPVRADAPPIAGSGQLPSLARAPASAPIPGDASIAGPRRLASWWGLSLLGAIALGGVLAVWFETPGEPRGSRTEPPAAALVAPMPAETVAQPAEPARAPGESSSPSPPAEPRGDESSTESPAATSRKESPGRRPPDTRAARPDAVKKAARVVDIDDRAQDHDPHAAAQPIRDPAPRKVRPRFQPSPDDLAELEKCRASGMTGARAQDCTRVACRAGEADKALRWVRYLPLDQRAEITMQCKRLGIDLSRQDRSCEDPRDCP